MKNNIYDLINIIVIILMFLITGITYKYSNNLKDTFLALSLGFNTYLFIILIENRNILWKGDIYENL